MAAVKSKKPVSKKLKAGQKKKTNKWLILGGVAAVAIIGAVVVRFSSASTWAPIWDSNKVVRIDVPGDGLRATNTITITKGHTYRTCVTGKAQVDTGVRLDFSISDLNGRNPRSRALSTKIYRKGRTEKHCSAEFRATKSYRAQGFAIRNNETANLTTTYQSIEYLR